MHSAPPGQQQLLQGQVMQQQQQQQPQQRAMPQPPVNALSQSVYPSRTAMKTVPGMQDGPVSPHQQTFGQSLSRQMQQQQQQPAAAQPVPFYLPTHPTDAT